jgi:hypothetical protein
MAPQDEGRRIIRSLIGQEVSFEGFLGNELILDFGRTPADGRAGFRLWLEPPWHLSSEEGVLLGSFQCKTAGNYEEPCWQNIQRQVEKLRGKKVIDVKIDGRTNEICLFLSEGLMVRNFVNDPEHDHCWHLDDHASRLAVYADPKGFDLVDREDENRPAQ